MPVAATRWTRLRDAFSHAFAVRRDPLSDEQCALLDVLADEVARRRLTPLIAAGAEMMRPVAGVTGHSMTFFEPLLSAVIPAEKVESARKLLQHPDAIDALQERLDRGSRPAGVTHGGDS